MFIGLSSTTTTWIVLACLAAGILVLGRTLRCRIRVLVQSASAVIAIVLVAIASLSALADYDWNRSDILGAIGLGLSLLLAFVAGRFHTYLRTVRVGVVIPSLRPFHRELREGLTAFLQDGRYEILDPFAAMDSPSEDLSRFPQVMHEALLRKADVLVICAPSRDLANNPLLVEACRALVRRGGHVCFIESVPDDSILDDLGDCSSITSDSSASAALLCEWIQRQVASQSDEGYVLHIPGPSHSRPAMTRELAMRTNLPDGIEIEVLHTQSWSNSETEAILDSFLHSHSPPQVVICGNDDMAQGAAQCLSERGLRIPVVGHDGLRETLVLIDDAWSPIEATIRLPPASFGHLAGSVIASLPPRLRALLPGYPRRGPTPVRLQVPVTRASLVTKYTAGLSIRR